MLFSGCLHKSFQIKLKQIKLELIWKQIEADFHNQHTVYQTPGWYCVNYFFHCNLFSKKNINVIYIRTAQKYATYIW